MNPREETLAKIVEFFQIDYTHSPTPFEIRNTTRVDLARFLGTIPCRVGVEIGVESGRYAKVLFEHNPGLRLYGVDPWETYDGYREHVTPEKQEQLLAAAKSRLINHDWIPIRNYSVPAASQFEDQSLDFVYIDGNHDFLHVVEDLTAWTPKVRSGGIIAGHDFTHRRLCDGMTRRNHVHVADVIPAWTQAYEIHPWFVFGTAYPVPGEVTEESRSFMWVKE